MKKPPIQLGGLIASRLRCSSNDLNHRSYSRTMAKPAALVHCACKIQITLGVVKGKCPRLSPKTNDFVYRFKRRVYPWYPELL